MTIRQDVSNSRKRSKPASKSPLLFLCHSHKDKQYARKLARDLSELAVDVWFDEWELTPGDSLHGCIGQALTRSAFIAVLLTPDSVKSRWCRSELQEGLAVENRKRRKIIIPLLCRRVALPAFLEDRLYADFNRAYYPALARLTAFIQAVDSRLVSDELSRTPPRSVEDVRKLLSRSGWDSIQWVEAKRFEAIRRNLKRGGINLTTDEFVLIPTSKSKNGKPRRPIKIRK